VIPITTAAIQMAERLAKEDGMNRLGLHGIVLLQVWIIDMIF